MGSLVMAGTVVLVVLGFGDHVWWLVAVALLYLYAQHGRGSSAAGSGTSAGSAPTTYQAYRARRDQQAKWERRYRRERPHEARRQERGR
ncbi:hypothetical protein [Streptomyces sp. enrichment culture]|uniref:hypothetical protein n=1 Tax=Streptomyces sp. enrichment culture TaxID=1795815 RepID=UPI003F54E6CB